MNLPFRLAWLACFGVDLACIALDLTPLSGSVRDPAASFVRCLLGGRGVEETGGEKQRLHAIYVGVLPRV